MEAKVCLLWKACPIPQSFRKHKQKQSKSTRKFCYAEQRIFVKCHSCNNPKVVTNSFLSGMHFVLSLATTATSCMPCCCHQLLLLPQKHTDCFLSRCIIAQSKLLEEQTQKHSFPLQRVEESLQKCLIFFIRIFFIDKKMVDGVDEISSNNFDKCGNFL